VICNELGIEVDGEIDLELEASPSPAFALTGTPATVLGLTGAGAAVLDLDVSPPVVLGLAGSGALTFDLSASTFSLGLSEANFSLGLECTEVPIAFLIEDPPGSGLWRQDGVVFVDIAPVGDSMWVPFDPAMFVGGPPLWEYVGA